jgi:hypothetical protein
MSYRVTSSHAEPLRDGRMVGPGDSISDADAKKNPQLVERGVLVKKPEKQKPKSEHGTEAAHKPASQEKKEESK